MLTICYSYTRTLLSKQWFWVTFLIFPEQFRGISDKNSSQLHNTTCLCGVNILKHRTTTHHTLRPSETNGETRPVKLGIRLVNVLSLKIASLQSITKPVTFSHKMYCASKRPLSEDHTLEQKAVLSMPRKGGGQNEGQEFDANYGGGHGFLRRVYVCSEKLLVSTRRSLPPSLKTFPNHATKFGTALSPHRYVKNV